MSISLNDHENRISALEKTSISGMEVDCGKFSIPNSGNGYRTSISFNKTFSKIPSVAINGSTGRVGGNTGEGAVVIDITTSGFLYKSEWESGYAYTLTWIAIAISYSYRKMTSSFTKEVLLCLFH